MERVEFIDKQDKQEKRSRKSKTDENDEHEIENENDFEEVEIEKQDKEIAEKKLEHRRTLEFMARNPASFLDQQNVLKQSTVSQHSDTLNREFLSPSPTIQKPQKQSINNPFSDSPIIPNQKRHSKQSNNAKNKHETILENFPSSTNVPKSEKLKSFRFPRLKKSDSLSEAVSDLLDNNDNHNRDPVHVKWITRLHDLFRRKWPYFVLVIIAIIAGLTSIALLQTPDTLVVGVPLFKWAGLLSLTCILFVLVRAIVAGIVAIVQLFLRSGRNAYYIRGSHRSVAHAIWASITYACVGPFLRGADPIPFWWINNISLSVLVYCWFRVLAVLINKILKVKFQPKVFWHSLSKQLHRERVLSIMAAGHGSIRDQPISTPQLEKQFSKSQNSPNGSSNNSPSSPPNQSSNNANNVAPPSHLHAPSDTQFRQAWKSFLSKKNNLGANLAQDAAGTSAILTGAAYHDEDYESQKHNHSSSKQNRRLLHDSVVLAERIFKTFHKYDDNDVLTEKDVIDSNLFANQDEARKAFMVFRLGKNDSALTREEIMNSIYELLKSRTSLNKTVADREAISNILGDFVSITFVFFSFLVILAVFDIQISSVWVSFSTSVLALTFMFGNQVKEAFESAVWIFNFRAFDVDDRITYAANEFICQIRKIHLICTEAVTSDGRVIYIPNFLLAKVPVFNLRKSTKYTIAGALAIPLNVSGTQIASTEAAIRQWLMRDVIDNKNPWDLPSASFWLTRTRDTQDFNFSIDLRVSHTELGTWRSARSHLLLYLNETLALYIPPPPPPAVPPPTTTTTSVTSPNPVQLAAAAATTAANVQAMQQVAATTSATTQMAKLI